MSYCQNCGKESHCGIPLHEEYRDVYDNRRGVIKVCDSCRCEKCTKKDD